MNDVSPSVIYTPRDSARILGVCPATIKNMFESGKLPGFKLSDGQRCIPGSSLLAELQRRQAMQQAG